MTTRSLRRPSALGLTCSVIALVCVMGPSWADQRPTGGRVVAGDASIGGRPDGLLITQGSDRAVIDWAGFSIGNGQTVNFDNGDGATLNRVTGNRITRIDGSLTASGSVFVINDNGVVVGRDGVVDVGGSFVASTLGVTTGGFMRGGDQSFAGQSTAAVINLGQIGALGGDVALIGAEVVNRGSISAPQGTAGLVAGYDVIMRDAALADGQFVVRLGGPDSGVLNTGRIEAAAAELRANGGNVLALAGNTDGLIRAEGIAREGGRVFLTAPGGRVQVDSTVEAQARNGAGGEIVLNAREVSVGGVLDVSAITGPGGEITVEGGTIWLGTTSVLDATGGTGGLIRVGGDLQGGQVPGYGAAMTTARDVTVASGATIAADGLAGRGGTVILWADGTMDYQGALSATGTGSGPGGFAEVSGGHLLYHGTADLRSTSGAFGELLLDPFNIRISSQPSTGSGFTGTVNDSVINVDTLVAALGTANVTVFTGNPGGQDGNITVAAPISWSSGSNLTLRAANHVAINRAIRAPDGGLRIDAGNAVSASGAIDVGLFELVSGHWVQRYETDLPAFSATDFRISDGTFLRAISECDECTLYFEDVYGLQGIANNPDLEFEFMYLGAEIDATGTRNWNNGAGFVPIGTETVPFGAVLDGNGHAIVGLTINRPDEEGVGLFGYLTDAEINEVRLVDADITGLRRVGAIAGYAGAFSVDSFSNYSLITDSWATGTVTAVNDRAGGLVGDADDLALESSWARVDVTGRSRVGGLVGELEISGDYFSVGLYETYAVGSVTATGPSGTAGGLIGLLNNQGLYYSQDIYASYASGAVSGAVAGGLVGETVQATISLSRWDVDTTGQEDPVGQSSGNDFFNDVLDLSTDEARDADFYDGFGESWFFGDDMRPMLRSTYASEVWIPEQLQLIGENPNTDVILMRDIDLGAALDDPSGIWGDAGWLPIGLEYLQGSTSFMATFDGNNHVIDGLRIDRPDGFVGGLFGSAMGATIWDLGLTNVSVRTVTTAGALAGSFLNGTLDNVFAQGRVEATSTQGNVAGGLVASISGSTVSNVTADVDVIADEFIGGLFGAMTTSTLDQGSASGDVTGNNNVGGLIGDVSDSTITQSFATGRVTGADADSTGGFIGTLWGVNTISGSFWDEDSTGQTEGVGDGLLSGPTFRTVPGVIGLTTEEFTNTATFMTLAGQVGWDFTESWAPPSPGFYPSLYAQSAVVALDLDPASRRYGQSNAVVVINGVSYGGPDLYAFGPQGDSLIINAATLLSGVAPSAPVGTYAFGANGLISALGVNYRVVNVGGALTITPALLTVRSDDVTRLYGQDDPDFAVRVTGFVLGEGRSLLTGALDREAGENVRATPYALNLGTLSAGGNYTLQLAGRPGLTINPALLTVTAENATKVYGDADPVFDFIITGLVRGDGPSLVQGTLDREAGENVQSGPYRFTLGTLTAGGNYVLQISGGNGLFVTPRALTVAADDLTQIFGSAEPPLTWQIVDGRLVFNDQISGDLTREEGSAPGLYAILQGSLTAGANYDLTFVPGTLTISGTEITRNSELGAKQELVIDEPELVLEPEVEPRPEPSDTEGSLVASTEQTDEIVREIEDASSYCSIIGQSEYVVDCLSERLAVIAAKLPTSGDYAPARAAIDRAAQQLSALVAANEDRDFPAGLTRSLRPDAPETSRPLRAVRTDTIEETLAAASGILRETQTLLLRSIPESAESIHYQRIASAVGSGSTLLRSI